jgi:hypothetical protein
MRKYKVNKLKFARFILVTIMDLFVIWFFVSWTYNIICQVSYDDIINGNASNWNLLNIAVRLGEHI